MNTQLLAAAEAFISLEADMLDHAEYDDWLDLWTDDGLYIVPIDADATDFANTLNYAHDDSTMRRQRVTRLRSGEAVSTTPPPRVLRSVSRLRLLGEQADLVSVRCAQMLDEFNKGRQVHYAADVSYELKRSADSFRIRRKIVRLVNSEATLQTIAYIL